MKNRLKFLYLLIIVICFVGVFLTLTKKKSKENEQDLAMQKSVCEEILKVEKLDLVNRFEGEPAPINFSKFPKAKRYYTVITESASSGPNFAGHFTVITWGCGTDCFQYAVVDAITGEMIAYSSANDSYRLRKNHDWENQYLILDPVYAGGERKFYGIVEERGINSLELVCTETAEEDMYGLTE